MAFKFPFTNYHELNLTWILDQLKSLFEKSEENVTVIENYDGRLTAVETELPSVADTAQDAAQTAAAAASLAQTAKATADTAQENAIQAQSAAGTARQEAQDAQTAAASAIQAAHQAQATAQNFDGRITQAENDASEALEASQSFENRVQAAINTANNAASTATNAQGIATNANQNAADALDKVGNLNDLKTSAKNNLVTALNEVTDKSVKDVQIGGQSIVASGIASIPLASSARLGVIRPLQNGGVIIDAQGRISTARASLASIKTAIANYPVIVPSNQYAAVFYGLATAAGDSTQAASSNEVGTYTEQAKAAILAMLGITDKLNAKQNAPTAAGSAGQVLGLDTNLNPVWIENGGGGGGGGSSAWELCSRLTWTMEEGGTERGNVVLNMSSAYIDEYEFMIVGYAKSSSSAARQVTFLTMNNTVAATPYVWGKSTSFTSAVYNFFATFATDNAVLHGEISIAGGWGNWLANNISLSNAAVSMNFTKKPELAGTHVLRDYINMQLANMIDYDVCLYRRLK